MKSDNGQVSNVAELAALYLTGALSEDERTAVEARISSGDSEMIASVCDMQAAVQALGDAAQPVAPSASIKQALMDQIAHSERESSQQSSKHQVWKRWSGDSANEQLFTLSAGEGSWDETGVAGVQVRRLFVDKERNRMTAMFRMAPGSSYPEHVHDGPEECYVLQGDLHVGDSLIMRAGDYQRAMPGSEHDEQWTEGGCLLLVTSSLSDELI